MSDFFTVPFFAALIILSISIRRKYKIAIRELALCANDKEKLEEKERFRNRIIHDMLSISRLAFDLQSPDDIHTVQKISLCFLEFNSQGMPAREIDAVIDQIAELLCKINNGEIRGFVIGMTDRVLRDLHAKEYAAIKDLQKVYQEKRT